MADGQHLHDDRLAEPLHAERVLFKDSVDAGRGRVVAPAEVAERLDDPVVLGFVGVAQARVENRHGPGTAVAAGVPDAAQVDPVDDRQLLGIEELGEVPAVGVVLLVTRCRVPGRALELGHDGGQLIVFLTDRGIAVQLSDQRRHVMRRLEHLRRDVQRCERVAVEPSRIGDLSRTASDEADVLADAGRAAGKDLVARQWAALDEVDRPLRGTRLAVRVGAQPDRETVPVEPYANGQAVSAGDSPVDPEIPAGPDSVPHQRRLVRLERSTGRLRDLGFEGRADVVRHRHQGARVPPVQLGVVTPFLRTFAQGRTVAQDFVDDDRPLVGPPSGDLLEAERVTIELHRVAVQLRIAVTLVVVLRRAGAVLQVVGRLGPRHGPCLRVVEAPVVRRYEWRTLGTGMRSHANLLQVISEESDLAHRVGKVGGRRQGVQQDGDGRIRVRRDLVDLVDDHLPGGAGVARGEAPHPLVGSRLEGAQVARSAERVKERTRLVRMGSDVPVTPWAVAFVGFGVEPFDVRLVPPAPDLTLLDLDVPAVAHVLTSWPSDERIDDRRPQEASPRTRDPGHTAPVPLLKDRRTRQVGPARGAATLSVISRERRCDLGRDPLPHQTDRRNSAPAGPAHLMFDFFGLRDFIAQPSACIHPPAGV